ncbi:MAG: polysaccharide deacetylase family protein [Paludibacteraceae bacterium]|nr:polysaccharide deacetylase family protein [Paludibacteraceae bacterium]
MQRNDTIFQKLQRKWMKLRLQPIRVFCLHHVCQHFDSDTMYACDWMALDEFKQKIIALRNQGYQFISLTAAYEHLKKDYFRRKKYAVLTFDDGYKSLKEILPWLEEQKIPATLFINGKYLDGKSYRETPKEQYLTYDELFALTSPLIEIGHHGWEHKSAKKMSHEELVDSLQKNIEILSSHPRYIPLWAYTYGIHNQNSDFTLFNNGMTLVLVNGGRNYKWIGAIDRELL